MKKSVIYNLAMDAVLDSEYKNEIKLEILEELIEKRSLALYTEKQEEDAK